MTIEAFANHLSSHFGRHLFYWLSTESRQESNGLNLRLTDLINKFHAPLERGVQVLDHLLTLEEEDFHGLPWGSPYAHNYEPQIQHYEPENREVLPLAEQHRPSAMHCSNRMETLNNGNALHHSPPHNNSGHQTTEQRNSALSPVGSGSTNASTVGGTTSNSTSSSSSTSGEHNMQITQPISAPSSPLPSSPGALGSGTVAFCLPSSSSATMASSSTYTVGSGLVSSSSCSTHAASDTADTNWQAAKANVLERNAATMFNNELMSTTSKLSAATINSSGANHGSGSFVCAHNGSGISTALDTADPNWQASKATVLERNAAMFNNELMSDVKFIVGEDFDIVQTIPAHKYILATGSSVFYAMFYGGLAEKKQEIKVPDVEPSAFLTLLRYLYCDEIQLEPDNILATLYAAKKYIVPHLARACVNYLEVKLTAKNACLLLSQSRLFEEPELMQRCWEVIDAQAEMAIKSEDFVDIDLKTFESILSRETLNCKEIHLFEAALNWALNACQKMGIDLTAQNKRNVLGSALHLIRIPTMTLEEFANGVAQTGILTAQETIDIFLHFTAQTKPTLNYATRQRAGLKTQVCHRFQSCAYRSNQWRYRGRCDSIQFSVDRRIFIVGFGLYGSSTGAANYNVKIELKRLGRTLAENDTKFFSDGSSNTFHVFFENPIQIEPECYYTASVILDGNELSFFGQEGMTEVCMGNVTFQFQCSSESTNGTGVQGGQIPELIYYGPTAVVTGLNSPTNSHCGTPITGGSATTAQGSLGLTANLNTGGPNGCLATNADEGITTSGSNNDADTTNT